MGFVGDWVKWAGGGPAAAELWGAFGAHTGSVMPLVFGKPTILYPNRLHAQ